MCRQHVSWPDLCRSWQAVVSHVRAIMPRDLFVCCWYGLVNLQLFTHKAYAAMVHSSELAAQPKSGHVL